MNYLYHTRAKLFQKLKFLTSLIHICVCVSGARNVTFSQSFAYVLNGWHHTETESYQQNHQNKIKKTLHEKTLLCLL